MLEYNKTKNRKCLSSNLPKKKSYHGYMSTIICLLTITRKIFCISLTFRDWPRTDTHCLNNHVTSLCVACVFFDSKLTSVFLH